MTEILNQDDILSDNPSLSDVDSEAGDSEVGEEFSAILSLIDTAQLVQLGKSVRQRREPLYHGEEPVVGEPIFGSYHVLFPLQFPGEMSWLVKIPINGTADLWDNLSANALTAEANTMRLLKRETTIPLPEVFDFSSTTDNSIGFPYMIISFVTGKPLYDIWFAHRLNNVNFEDVMEHRKKALNGIAKAMAQLEKFSFDQSGTMLFDAIGNPSGVGPFRFLDQKAMLDRWFVHNDPSDDPIYVEIQPTKHPKEHFTFPLDLHEEEQPFPRGVNTLLRHLISWIPEPESETPFVLAHPDFDIQNFIVADDGQLLAIIDWDGVAAVPRSVGNVRYPGWLTRDWDPAMYGYEESMEDGVEPEGVWEDSPTELLRCRALYRSLMKQARMDGGSSVDTNDKTCMSFITSIYRYLMKQTGMEGESYVDTDDVTRTSIITENLAIAAQDSRCRNPVLTKLVSEISAVYGGDEEFNFIDLVNMCTEDKLDDKIMQKLRAGFEKLLSKDSL